MASRWLGRLCVQSPWRYSGKQRCYFEKCPSRYFPLWSTVCTKIQNIFVRNCRHASSGDHAIPFFIDSKILPLNFLYFYNTACLMHDIINNNSPLNIADLFTEISRVVPDLDTSIRYPVKFRYPVVSGIR